MAPERRSNVHAVPIRTYHSQDPSSPWLRVELTTRPRDRCVRVGVGDEGLLTPTLSLRTFCQSQGLKLRPLCATHSFTRSAISRRVSNHPTGWRTAPTACMHVYTIKLPGPERKGSYALPFEGKSLFCPARLALCERACWRP